eukprot:jgi/Ulvmu1/11868/UM081_0026.1
MASLSAMRSMQLQRAAGLRHCRPLSQRFCTVRRRNAIVRSQADEEIEDVSKDVWDSPAIGVAVQIGFAAIIVAAVAAILALGKPVVDYTFSVFPSGTTYQEGLYSP